jgi:hypothetical protein
VSKICLSIPELQLTASLPPILPSKSCCLKYKGEVAYATAAQSASTNAARVGMTSAAQAAWIYLFA